MWPNPQQIADFVTFTEEILNVKLHFFVHWARLPLQNLNFILYISNFKSFELLNLK